MMASRQVQSPDVAEIGTNALATGRLIGPPSRLTCPECGGAVWELVDEGVVRYRCHVGHGYTAKTMMAAQSDALEDALWSALRGLEEMAEMSRRMAARAEKGNWSIIAEQYREQAESAEVHAETIRAVLTNGGDKELPESPEIKGVQRRHNGTGKGKRQRVTRATKSNREPAKP